LARYLQTLSSLLTFTQIYQTNPFMLERISKLKDRQFRALTGLDKQSFNQLAVIFSECDQEQKARHYAEYEAYYDRKPSSGGKPALKTPSERLFLTLFYLKTYPTFDVLGFTFNCSGKTAYENVYKCLSILEAALEKLEVLPKRNFESVEAFKKFIGGNQDILIDVTERLHHRKKEQEAQKKYYTRKKKAHTVKNTIIALPTQQVLFTGATVLGAIHDFRLLKEEFPPEKAWFTQVNVWVDLGYLGIAKNYEVLDLKIPFKKARKSKNNPNPKLTPEQKQHNKEVSSVRVKVENAIGGIKRYNILVQKLRNKNTKLRDKVIYYASGIWNFSKGFSFA